MITNSLEDRYEPLCVDDVIDRAEEYHIVVLGGGHGFDDRLPSNSLLSREALGRLNEGIRLYRQFLNSKLVLSGYSSSGSTTQAEMLQQTAILLGVDEERTIIQKEPGNTYQEAEVYAEKYGNRYPVILVTGAIHMPRAMMAFSKKRIIPIASPTNYRLKGSWKRKWFGWPNPRNIENFKTSINEYVGLFWYGSRR